MGGFKPGDDVLANINVLAYDAALNGGVAGPVLLRLMQVVSEGRTIFHRTDALRAKPAFRECRSFTLSFGGTEAMVPAEPASAASDPSA